MVCATLAVYGPTLEARDSNVSRAAHCLALRLLVAVWQSLEDGAGLEERSRFHDSAAGAPDARFCLGSFAARKSNLAAAAVWFGSCLRVLGILCVRTGDRQSFRARSGAASVVARRLLWSVLLPAGGCICRGGRGGHQRSCLPQIRNPA